MKPNLAPFDFQKYIKQCETKKSKILSHYLYTMKKLKTTELNRLSIQEFQKTNKNDIIVVLDNVRSLNNVGSAFRTSDAFAINKLYLCGITGKPPHRDITKTAIGAQDSVDWVHFEKIEDAISSLKEHGYKIILLEQTDKSVFLNEFTPRSNEKYAFVFGNEVFGVSDSILSEADICLEIPQYGTKHSLNVSVTIGITLWDYISKTKGA